MPDFYSSYLLKILILKHFEICGKSYLKDDVESFLTANSLDFSDKAIEQLCSKNNFVLLTNDGDFKDSKDSKDSKVDILSENSKIN